MNTRRISAAMKLSPPKLSLKKRSSASPKSTSSTVSIKVFLRPVTPDLFVPHLPCEGEPITPGNDQDLMKHEHTSEQSTDFGPNTPSSFEAPRPPSPIIVPCIDENDHEYKRIAMKPCYSTPNKKARRKVAQSRGIPRSNFVSSPRHILRSLNILDNDIENINRRKNIVPSKTNKCSIATPKVLHAAPMLSPPPLRPLKRSSDCLFSIRRRLTESVAIVDSWILQQKHTTRVFLHIERLRTTMMQKKKASLTHKMYKQIAWIKFSTNFRTIFQFRFHSHQIANYRHTEIMNLVYNMILVVV